MKNKVSHKRTLKKRKALYFQNDDKGGSTERHHIRWERETNHWKACKSTKHVYRRDVQEFTSESDKGIKVPVSDNISNLDSVGVSQQDM